MEAESVWSDVFQEIFHLESRRRRTSRLPSISAIYFLDVFYRRVHCKKTDMKSPIHKAISITHTKKGKFMLDQQHYPECCPKRAVGTNNFTLSDAADVRAPSMHCSINHVLMIIRLLFCCLHDVTVHFLIIVEESNVCSLIQNKHHRVHSI